MAGELLELMFTGDPQLRVRVLTCVQNTIIESFKQDRSRVTQDEIRRRFKILETTIRELRREHEWAWTRILDALPIALRSKLDGVWWDPTKQRAVWMPDQKL